MNHSEIKKQARQILLRDFKTIAKPLLIIFIVNLLVSSLADGLFIKHLSDPWQIEIFTNYHISFVESMVNTIINYLLLPLSIGYVVYLLNYFRNKSHNLKDLTKPYENFALILVITIIVQLLTTLGFIFLIIPGVIVSLMFSFANYLIADNEQGIANVLSKTIELIDGYKIDYLIFILSFVGWLILCPFTFFIAAIWVFPYFILSTVIYYENLKSIKKL